MISEENGVYVSISCIAEAEGLGIPKLYVFIDVARLALTLDGLVRLYIDVIWQHGKQRYIRIVGVLCVRVPM